MYWKKHDTPVNYNKDAQICGWAERNRNEKRLKRQDKWQLGFAVSSTQAMEKSKDR